MRTIYHVDMDAFYASVETVENPELKGKPMVVGGLSPHGIVAAANYEARKYGIHSAMPIFMAKQRCPNLIIRPSNRKKYAAVSEEIFAIFERFTSTIEKVSIDEAYLDFTPLPLTDLSTAKEIKRQIFAETGLTASIGISYNKFLAKLASDWKKPDGLTVFGPEDVDRVLLPLPLDRVHGIGPKTAERLSDMGLHTVEELRVLDRRFLEDILGKFGPEIYDRIRGIDYRPVEVDRERKSLGVERTFDADTGSYEKILAYLKDFCDGLEEDLKKRNIQGRTVVLKIKDSDFRVFTRSKTLTEPIYKSEDLFEIGKLLLDEMPKNLRIRLLGITAASLSEMGIQQMSIYDFKEKKRDNQ